MSEHRFEMIKKHNGEEFALAMSMEKADKQILSLCAFINAQQDFFSSSSCAGRIMLLKADAIESKQEHAFHAKWHRKVKLQELLREIAKKIDEEELWLKQEPFILHLGARNLEGAKKLLECCRAAGIKRAGIMVAEEQKFIVEIIGTQNMSLPVKKRNKQLVDKKYLDFVLEKANGKLARNYVTLKKFEEILRVKLAKE